MITSLVHMRLKQIEAARRKQEAGSIITSQLTVGGWDLNRHGGTKVHRNDGVDCERLKRNVSVEND